MAKRFEGEPQQFGLDKLSQDQAEKVGQYVMSTLEIVMKVLNDEGTTWEALKMDVLLDVEGSQLHVMFATGMKDNQSKQGDVSNN